MKFSANINTLFQELPYLERFEAVKIAGIDAIEIHDPYCLDLQSLKEHKGSLKVELINSYQGDKVKFGVSSVPGEEIAFLKHFSKTIDVAFHLECPKVHILAGLKNDSFSDEEQTTTFVQNLVNASGVLEELLM